MVNTTSCRPTDYPACIEKTIKIIKLNCSKNINRQRNKVFFKAVFQIVMLGGYQAGIDSVVWQCT